VLIGGLIAAAFFLFGPSDTSEGSVEPVTTGTAEQGEAQPIEAAPSLDPGTEGQPTVLRSSEADAAVVVKVVDVDGEPVPAFKLYLAESDERVLTLDGTDGSIGLADVSGIEGICAYADGSWSIFTELDSAPEQGSGKVIDLPLILPASSLEVRVKTEDGFPATAPWVEIMGDDDTPLAMVFLTALSANPARIEGADGLVALEGLPPGVYGFETNLEEYVPEREDLNLKQGVTEKVEVELSPSGQARGRVLFEGKPLAGAAVGLLPGDQDDGIFGFSLDQFRSYGDLPGSIPDFQKTTTDREGRFHLPTNAVGNYQVLVSAPEYLPQVFTTDREILPRQETDLGDFSLAKGFGLELLVRNEDGQPLEHVEIRWARLSSNTLITQRREDNAPTESTDAEGLALLSGLPGEKIVMTLEHEDFARQTEDYDFSGRSEIGTDHLEVTLDPGASVAGRVVDGRSGAPVTAASLGLKETTERSDFLSMFSESHWEAETGEDGTFRFARLPAGEYLLIAKHNDFSETQYGPFTIERTAIEDLTVMLHPGATLHVEVLDSEGLPVEDASVQVVNTESQIIETADTEANGIATLPPLKPGDYQVTFTDLAGFDTDNNTGSVDVKVKFVTLAENEEKTLTLGGIIAVADLEGEVRRGGELMARASVAIITDSGVKAGVADENGWYEIKDVPLGSFTQIVTAGTPLRGGSTTYDLVEIPEEGVMRHDIVLSESGVEIHVTAVGSGEGLANVPIAVRPLDGTNIQGGNFGLTDNEGILTLPSLEAGSYIISAGNLSAVFLATGDAGYGSAQLSPVVIREDGGVQRVEMQLDKGATFRVRVRDSAGNLLKGVHLHYLDTNGQPMNILSMKGTNSKGVAELEGLPAGPGIILVRHANLGAVEVPVHLAAGQLSKKEVTLQAGTLVYVTPLGSDGAPLPGILVTALDERGAPASFVWSMEETQATNAAFFSGSAQKVGPLLPGEYQIQLYRPGKPPVLHPLTVGGKEEMHLQLPYSTDEG
jgi:hypothetical protein